MVGTNTDTKQNNASHTPFYLSPLASFQEDEQVRPDDAEPEGDHLLREAVANTLLVTNSRTKLLNEHLQCRLHEVENETSP